MKNNLILNILIFLIFFFDSFYYTSTYKLKQSKKNLSDNHKNSPSKNPQFLQIQNPDQPSGGSTGGNSGEFVRRDQITEHIMIPLLNTFDVEFPFAKDIREFRKDYVDKINSDVKRALGINNQMNRDIPAIPTAPSCGK